MFLDTFKYIQSVIVSFTQIVDRQVPIVGVCQLLNISAASVPQFDTILPWLLGHFKEVQILAKYNSFGRIALQDV